MNELRIITAFWNDHPDMLYMLWHDTLLFYAHFQFSHLSLLEMLSICIKILKSFMHQTNFPRYLKYPYI